MYDALGCQARGAGGADGAALAAPLRAAGEAAPCAWDLLLQTRMDRAVLGASPLASRLLSFSLLLLLLLRCAPSLPLAVLDVASLPLAVAEGVDRLNDSPT